METKKIVSTLLAAGMAVPTLPIYAYADSSASLPESATKIDNDNKEDSFVSSVVVIDQTDTSITIKWDANNYKDYSISVNNKVIANNLVDDTYTITDLKSASEYFIQVSAYDENDVLAVSSDEICAYTNLTVSSNYTLTNDIKAANVNIDYGTLNLNGHSMTVAGNVWVSRNGGSANLNINKGNLYVNGDLNLCRANKAYGSGYLTMQSAEDYVCVGGDFYINSYYSYSTLTAGTLELKGDFTQRTGYYGNNFYASGAHKVILSGEGLQTVSFDSTDSQFNVVDVKNFSEDGVVFATAATVIELNENDCNVTFANGEKSGWTLEEDQVIEGDLNLARGSLDLNGHKLTVTGNLIQSGGEVKINGGELSVQGDYRLQALNNGGYVNSTGTLNMTNEADTVKVAGSFVMQSNRSHNGILSAGTLEVGGDLVQNGGNYYNFLTTGTHTTVLNGSVKQTISIANNNRDYSRINNLKIENTSEGGINVATQVYVVGKLYNTDTPVSNSTNIKIAASTEFADNAWNYGISLVENRSLPDGLEIGGDIVESSNITLSGDVNVGGTVNIDYGTLNLNGHTMTVTGNVWVSRSNSTAYLSINKGKLYVNGDFNLCHANKNYSVGYLTMQNAEDYVCVGGDFYINTYYSCSTLTAGTLELKGNFTQKFYGYSNNFYASGTHKVILSGEGLQTISFNNTDSQFNVVEITKPIDTGYVFSNTKWNDLIENYDEPTPPTAPYDLTFVRSTSTSIVLKWNSSIGFKDIFCYQVYRNGELVGTTTKTEYIDNGLTSHTKYEYYIVAVDVGGSRSENSSSLIAYTNVDQYAPTTPTGLVVKIREDGSIYATWIASSDNVRVDGYNIYRNGEIIDTVSGTSYKDLNVEPGYHEYYVEAFDNEGNTSMFSESVFIDNMHPRKPVLSINEITSASISFEWDSEDNIGISQYKIYKNDQLLRTTADNQYVDTAVLAGEKYSYYVIAIDTSGNVSEASDLITLVAGEDENAPESVLKSSNLTDNNKILTIQCADDVLLSSVKVEIKSSSSDEWEKILEQKLSQRIQNVNIDMSDRLETGGTYFVRATLIDAFGNENINEYQFAYYANELSKFEVKAKADGCGVILSWTAASNNSNVYYTIYQVDESGNEKRITSTKYDALSCNITGLQPVTDYSYKVVARDSNSYSAESNTITIKTGKDQINPVASANFNSVTLVGYELSFDGRKSWDNNKLVKYTWDFGDGKTAEGMEATHKYAKGGIYTVSLTVTDESGNTNTDSSEITVYGSDYSISEIKVVDALGTPIANAVALADSDKFSVNKFIADSNGVIPIVAKAGSYDFYFYSDGYLPAKQNITLAGIQTGSSAEKVVLSASEIVSAKFDIKELDIEQIKDLGIDTKDPSNRYVYEIKMDVVSEKTDATVSGDTILRNFHVTVNQDGEFLDISGNKDFKKSYKIENESKTSTDQGTITRRTQVTTLKIGLDQTSGNQGTSYPDTVTPIKTLVCLSVTEYSWLKDFYNVSISFTNNSPEGFDIIDPVAELLLPEGLELGDSTVPMIKTMPTVSGGNTVTVSWLVKGTTQGTHNVSVNFTGTLTPFDVPITAVFSDTITVSVKDSLVFDIYENRYGVSKFTLTNASSLDEDKYNNTLYDVCVTMQDKEEFNDAEYIVLKYPSGLIEKIEWADDSKTKTKSTVYLPVTVSHNVDLVSLRTLEKGQKIEGVIYYSFREIDD